MFLRSYFESLGFRDEAGWLPLSLIPLLRLYLTGFLKRTFPGEIALNRGFCRGKTQSLQAFTTPRLTKALRHENRRFVDAVFTSHPSAVRAVSQSMYPAAEHSGRHHDLTAAHHFDYHGNMEKEQAIAALAALAQENRLDAFRLLVQAGPEGMAAGEVAAALDVPANTLSFHFDRLRNAGLVKVQRQSRSLIYSAKYETMNALLGYLTENCCQGKPEECVAIACGPGAVRQSKKESAA
jgi:ArsR family transcriptional regulator, arsenate/arsenite/antimonite-responsive transcriptional repressor